MRISKSRPGALVSIATLLAIGLLLLTTAQTANAESNSQPVNVDPGAPQPTDAEKAERFRRSFGLRSDVVWIDQVAKDPAASKQQFGVPLLPEEIRELETRFSVAEDIPIIRRYAEAEAPDTFSGLYVDQARGGLIYVGFTRDEDRHLQALQERFPRPEWLRVFRAAYTRTELADLQNRIDGDLRRLEEMGVDVQSTGIDTPGNKVVISVSNPSAEVRDILRQRYGPAAEVTESRVQEAIRTSVQSPPLKGAIEIHRNTLGGYVQCSSGFITSSGGGAYYWVLTAGHCGTSGTVWYQGWQAVGLLNGPRIGGMNNNSFRYGSYADAAIIGMDASKRSNWVYVNGANRAMISYETSDYVGEPVCKSGITSEYTCGRLIDENYTVDYGDGVVLYRQKLADMYSYLGDSGGSVFYNNKAIGIVSGITCSSPGCESNTVTGTIYSHIVHSMNAVGVSFYAG